MAMLSFRSPMMGLEFPPTNGKTSSSVFTGWNRVAALRATGSALALSLQLPVFMGPVSRWWTTRRASNSDFGFRRPRGRDANGVLIGADTGVVTAGDPGHARAPAWRSHPDRQRIILALPRPLFCSGWPTHCERRPSRLWCRGGGHSPQFNTSG